MEISQVITGMILFGFGMFIADLYNEVKKLKSLVFGDRAYRPDPITRPFSSRLIEAKDEEIKELKAELNKAKFDYACEVAGKK